MSLLSQAGLAVPDDMMMIALGEGANESFLSPPVTTVSPLGVEMGSRLADAAVELINGGSDIRPRALWELEPRESTRAGTAAQG